MSRTTGKVRTGLRIRGQRGNPVVRRAFIKFARWARKEFEFPTRVPVYLGKGETIRSISGKRVSATFFGPYSRKVEPYIRVATGDYPKLRSRMGSYQALAVTLHSLCHELVHYEQWRRGRPVSERGVEVRASRILKRYFRGSGHAAQKGLR